MIVQRNNDDTIREEINKKNRELSSYLDEIKVSKISCLLLKDL